MDGIVYNWLEKNKDAIIDKTSALLADKLARTKTVKESMAKIIENTKWLSILKWQESTNLTANAKNVVLIVERQ